jgi:hypothetical protein
MKRVITGEALQPGVNVPAGPSVPLAEASPEASEAFSPRRRSCRFLLRRDPLSGHPFCFRGCTLLRAPA